MSFLNNYEFIIINNYENAKLRKRPPVVWNYAENLDDQFMMGFWEHFAKPFPYMWAASAFKGLLNLAHKD